MTAKAFATAPDDERLTTIQRRAASIHSLCDYGSAMAVTYRGCALGLTGKRAYALIRSESLTLSIAYAQAVSATQLRAVIATYRAAGAMTDPSCLQLCEAERDVRRTNRALRAARMT